MKNLFFFIVFCAWVVCNWKNSSCGSQGEEMWVTHASQGPGLKTSMSQVQLTWKLMLKMPFYSIVQKKNTFCTKSLLYDGMQQIEAVSEMSMWLAAHTQ